MQLVFYVYDRRSNLEVTGWSDFTYRDDLFGL